MRILFVCVSLCVAALPGIAGAQSHAFGFQLGWAEWNNTVYGGGHARVSLAGAGIPLMLQPSFDYFFTVHDEWAQFDLNLAFPIGGPTRSGVVPFVGAGYALLYEARSEDHHHHNIILLRTEGPAAIEHNTRGEINFHSAMNAVAGIFVNAGPSVQPFLQGRYTILNGNYFSVSLGAAVRI